MPLRLRIIKSVFLVFHLKFKYYLQEFAINECIYILTGSKHAWWINEFLFSSFMLLYSESNPSYLVNYLSIDENGTTSKIHELHVTRCTK